MFERLRRRRQAPDGGAAATAPDLAYGPHPAQRLDVYRPPGAAGAAGAPLLFLVHGGAWQIGDKAGPRVVRRKVAHWVGQGWVLVSVNYRLVPDADPVEQAEDIARALAFVQQHALRWGADPTRCVLMGHSSGAHLLALLNADGSAALRHGLQPWRATVALDSAAYDVESLMNQPHAPWLDAAFGSDRSLWRRASPTLRLQQRLPAPMLLVCSTRRDQACAQARAFADKAGRWGEDVAMLPLDIAHGQLNAELGTPGELTSAVDAFLSRAVSG